jgi:phosphohistidine swiveling domain-containing protein
MKIRATHYEKHQRDYPLFGTSLMLRAFFSAPTSNYFSYLPHPMYVMIKDRILYHFYAMDDAKERAKKWLKKYGTVEQLRKHKIVHDKNLEKFRQLIIEKKITDPLKNLRLLDKLFNDLLPVILVAIELPEYKDKRRSGALLNLCKSIRDENEDVYKVGFEFQKKLLNLVERKDKLSSNTLQYLTAREFNRYVKSKKLPKNIERRKEFVFIKQWGTNERIYIDPKAPKRLGIVDDADHAISNVLNGQCAFPGQVKGRVRIIKLVDDAKLLKKNEILVTAMTDPRYVPLMKKALAIITNEGGVTCHAAIVSRELKKPCIVGTKYATHVLSNGSLVEVDATRGIVTILKSGK